MEFLRFVLYLSIIQLIFENSCYCQNIISFNTSLEISSQQDCLAPYCLCTGAVFLMCSNFTSFGQLNFTRTNSRLFHYVEIRPLKQLDLNRELSFIDLNLHGQLSLYNLKSLELSNNPFKQIKCEKLDLGIYDSDISYNEQCSFGTDLVFSGLKLSEFRMNNVNFTQPLCPYMFQNTEIDHFIVTNPNGKFNKRLK